VGLGCNDVAATGAALPQPARRPLTDADIHLKNRPDFRSHRERDVEDVVEVMNSAQAAAGEQSSPRPNYDWAKAQQK